MKIQTTDLKTFADPDFDPKLWINKAWSSSGSQDKEVFVANTVSRLQLYMKQLTNSLDEATTQIVTSLPRVVQDAALLHEEGLLLQQRLLSLEEKVQGVEEQTGHSIESLQRIDKLKSKLESAASTLQEADKWAALTSSLENILESGIPPYGEELSELSSQVTAMTQSLDVLSEASDYDDKRVQLETLYNRLEAAISPPLIDAISQMDAERTATYVGVFGGMGRRGAARGCWRRAAATRLAAAWRRLEQHSLPALTRLLSTHANSQIDWLTGVLQCETPLSELLLLYTDLLQSLDPSPIKVVTASMKLCATPEEGIQKLINLRRDIEELVSAINSIINTPRPNQELIQRQVKSDFVSAAAAPLREVLPQYTGLQTQILNATMDEDDAAADGLLASARRVLERIRNSESHVDESFNTSREVAGPATYSYYRPCLEDYLSRLKNLIVEQQRRVEVEFHFSVAAGRVAGVLSEAFAATLVLETAASAMIDSFHRRYQEQRDALAIPNGGTEPLEEVVFAVYRGGDWNQFEALRAAPPAVIHPLNRIRDQLIALAKNILKAPIEKQLDNAASLSAWTNNDPLTTDLPDFALSPQEYITEIGQYLMTLPQHLEMHVSEQQQSLQFLNEICTITSELYAQKILLIRHMDLLGNRRCLTDISYLSSIMEDLGCSLTPALRRLEDALKTPQGNRLATDNYAPAHVLPMAAPLPSGPPPLASP